MNQNDKTVLLAQLRTLAALHKERARKLGVDTDAGKAALAEAEEADRRIEKLKREQESQETR